MIYSQQLEDSLTSIVNRFTGSIFKKPPVDAILPASVMWGFLWAMVGFYTRTHLEIHSEYSLTSYNLCITVLTMVLNYTFDFFKKDSQLCNSPHQSS